MNSIRLIDYAKTQPLAGSALLLIKEIQNSIQVGLDLLNIALASGANHSTDEISSHEAENKIISCFYQAACALDWIDQDGISAVLELMQSAATTELDNKSARVVQVSAALCRCGDTLLKHLSAISMGYQIPPIRLFPCYRDLYVLLKKGNAHPAALLSLVIVDSDFSGFRLTDKNYLPYKKTDNLRAEFEQALLIFLRTKAASERKAAAEEISIIIYIVSQKQTADNQRLHWQVLYIFSECVIADAFPDLGSAKKIFAAIGHQIRHLEDAHPLSPPRQLIREVLFEIAQVSNPTILVSQVLAAYRLSFQLPADYKVDQYEMAKGNHVAAAIASFLELLLAVRKTIDENLHAAASLQSVLAPLLNQLAVAAVDKFSSFSTGLQTLSMQLAEQKMTQQNMVSLAAWMLLLEQGLNNDLTALSWLEREKAMLASVLEEIVNGRNTIQIHHQLCRVAILLGQHATAGAMVAAALQLLSVAERKIEEAMLIGQYAEVSFSIDISLAQLAAACDLADAESAKKDLQKMRVVLDELSLSTEEEKNNQRCYEELALQFVMLMQQVEKIHLDGLTISAEPFDQLPLRELPENTITDFSPGPVLHAIYLNESQLLIKQLDQLIQQWLIAPQQSLPASAAHAAHSLAGSSATVGLQVIQELAGALENILQAISHAGTSIPDLKYQILHETVLVIMQMLETLNEGRMPLAQTKYVQALAALQKQLQYPSQSQRPSQFPELPQFPQPDIAENSSVTPSALESSVAMDPELRALFMLEAEDLIPQLSQQMRALQEESDKSMPAAALLRMLHTLKGSARMAGADALGRQLHEMEYAVDQFARDVAADPAGLEKLLAQLDKAMHLFSLLVQETVKPAAGAAETSVFHASEKIVAPSIQLRVRADLLERISSSAAELTVGGARVANEFQMQRQAMSDLADNINRLRTQLRELEIQAESRIASQLQINTGREFDPLEFDHFTSLQELTRMMAESLGDIVSVQRTLARHVDDAGLAISAQSRYARNLQTDLRRVRIVQFSSIAERLHHLVRQVARELDKEVRLDIAGGNIELDRSMLEKMGAPLEHLLRNAIAHGIELPAMREQAGKPAVGCIKIILAQQGNDVIMQVSDDGQGLDLERIREKALAAGLLKADFSASDAELAALIFEPGLSTVDEITTIAGRGIGMDVVRATVLAQGGTLDVSTQSGIGLTFKLVLPLIQATTQVVLVSVGKQQFALPSAMVEQVLQLPAARARIARQAAAVDWRGTSLPLHHLNLLLGENPATVQTGVTEPPAQIVVLRGLHGSFAIELDAIHGNREVVVKNIGPQLAHVPGIAGATVLADGSVVLIINPLALIESAESERRAGRQHIPDLIQTNIPAAVIPLVLVVDDSLTVRRVSQRMLERCGYAVALARDGLDALEKLQAISPAVVLLDIEMPRMDGFELLRKLRQEPRTRNLPVVMITSRSADKHREHALQLGATAYLGKPFNEAELLALLKQLCTENILSTE